VRLFSRVCRSCGEKPRLTVAPCIVGRKGDVEVELWNLPYETCACGRQARWAFEPSREFAEQLFRTVAVARKPVLRLERCARCDADLEQPTKIELRAEARLSGFGPIGFRTSVPGFRCASCGLEQAIPGSFDVGKSGPVSDGALALAAAAATLGLR
jgi:hypothetical protein